MFNNHDGQLCSHFCHNPTQQQLNPTRLRLDIIIKPNPPTPPTTPSHKLSKPAVVTVVTAWRQHYISLM